MVAITRGLQNLWTFVFWCLCRYMFCFIFVFGPVLYTGHEYSYMFWSVTFDRCFDTILGIFCIVLFVLVFLVVVVFGPQLLPAPTHLFFFFLRKMHRLFFSSRVLYTWQCLILLMWPCAVEGPLKLLTIPMCVCVCACVRACVRACVHACVRACIKEREREGKRESQGEREIDWFNFISQRWRY